MSLGILAKLALQLWGMTPADAHRRGICIECKRDIRTLNATIEDWQEWHISALCRDCFDKYAKDTDE